MAAYVVCAVVDSRGVRVGVSGDPPALAAHLRRRHDGRGEDRPKDVDDGLPQLIVLSSPLTFREATGIVHNIIRIKWWQRTAWPPFFRLAALRSLSWILVKQGGGRPGWQPVLPEAGMSPLAAELDAARRWLAGRCLLHSEAVKLLEQGGEGELTGDPLALIEVLTWEGDVVRQAALMHNAVGRWLCRRCGARGQVDVGYCVHCVSDDCASCTECASLGAARACQTIIMGIPDADGLSGLNSQLVRRGTERDGGADADALLHLPFALSGAQQRASDALKQAPQRRSLVWAACGAGKTEVVYGVIEQALLQGDDVLFAVPRRDIAAELTERIAQAFPAVKCHGLYGGVVEKFSQARLVVATTHQVLRFYERFSLIIVDEVDAFPYRGSAMLRRAVERALSPGGRLVYMTATPTEALLQRAGADGWALLTIPARHHGRPLPVPEFLLDPAMTGFRNALDNEHIKAAFPGSSALAVQRLVAGGHPLLVFVPTVRLVESTVAALRSLLAEGETTASIVVEGTHARDPHRDRRRQALQDGTLSVLVATTILERGVTIPGVNVMVLFADDERLFDSATLVQMAGRAGRTTELPYGQVIFCAAGRSRSMENARLRIQQLNDEAKNLGFLYPEEERKRRM